MGQVTYVPGPSLHDAMAICGPPPTQSMWLLIAGIAEVLQGVQFAGLVHWDRKPANVLLAQDGPRLIDFGIARASDASHLTRTGIRLGAPQFMAPEHILGKSLTFAADIFALGGLIVFGAPHARRSATTSTPPSSTVWYTNHRTCPDSRSNSGTSRPRAYTSNPANDRPWPRSSARAGPAAASPR
jgi:serine/threonine protein kinase